MPLSRTARRSPYRAALLSTATVTLLFGFLSSAAPAASAAAAKSAPGDNGDVKVHAVGTFFIDQRNEPHVCQFYLDAFNFDTIQKVSWTIDQEAPTGHAQASSGTLTLHNGAGQTSVMSLPVGHYKLDWTFEGEHGSAKHKVFWSDCAAVASPPPGSTVVGSGGTVLGTVNAAGEIIGPNGKPVLAATGVELTPWLAAGAGLVLGGTLLARRRRSAR
ncbi:MAG TPA: hypothetical protein VL551_02760 [Actinospica sp.]|jgi:hypothetical protein|nr:hypothetical protein [Actinospica sp.]